MMQTRLVERLKMNVATTLESEVVLAKLLVTLLSSHETRVSVPPSDLTAHN